MSTQSQVQFESSFSQLKNKGCSTRNVKSHMRMWVWRNFDVIRKPHLVHAVYFNFLVQSHTVHMSCTIKILTNVPTSPFLAKCNLHVENVRDVRATCACRFLQFVYYNPNSSINFMKIMAPESTFGAWFGIRILYRMKCCYLLSKLRAPVKSTGPGVIPPLPPPSHRACLRGCMNELLEMWKYTMYITYKFRSKCALHFNILKQNGTRFVYTIHASK